jgi:hypothetical protein
LTARPPWNPLTLPGKLPAPPGLTRSSRPSVTSSGGPPPAPQASLAPRGRLSQCPPCRRPNRATVKMAGARPPPPRPRIPSGGSCSWPPGVTHKKGKETSERMHALGWICNHTWTQTNMECVYLVIRTMNMNSSVED